MKLSFICLRTTVVFITLVALVAVFIPLGAFAAPEDFVDNPPPVDSELQGAPNPGTPPTAPPERPSSNPRGFVSLVPIPGLNTQAGASLADYLNSIFLLVISLAAMLAVLRIVWGGFQYMTKTESLKTTADARKTIQDAVVGLVLLLGTVLILQTINPAIVNLNALKFSELGPSSSVQQSIALTKEEREKRVRELQTQITTLTQGDEVTTPSLLSEDTRGGILEITGVGETDRRILRDACRKSGRTVREEKKWVCDKDGETYISGAGTCFRSPLYGGTGKYDSTKEYMVCEKK